MVKRKVKCNNCARASKCLSQYIRCGLANAFLYLNVAFANYKEFYGNSLAKCSTTNFLWQLFCFHLLIIWIQSKSVDLAKQVRRHLETQKKNYWNINKQTSVLLTTVICREEGWNLINRLEFFTDLLVVPT